MANVGAARRLPWSLGIMGLPDFARLAIAAVAGLIAPFVWAELLIWWSVYVYTPMLKMAWSAFALKGAPVFWMNTLLESVVFGALFGLALWALGRPKSLRVVAVFSIAFLIAFFAPPFVTSTAEEMLAGAWISAPSIVLLFATIVGTCYALQRRSETADA